MTPRYLAHLMGRFDRCVCKLPFPSLDRWPAPFIFAEAESYIDGFNVNPAIVPLPLP